jgi:cytochrome c peroxidase
MPCKTGSSATNQVLAGRTLPPTAPGRGYRKAWLLLVALCASAVAPALPQEPDLRRPAAREPITPIPSPPVQDPRRVALGDRLFHDPILSHDNTRRCASCHDTGTNGATDNAHDLTPDGQEIALNTPTVFNAALNFRLNWEGNSRALDNLSEDALLNPQIMATTIEEVLAKLRADPATVQQFEDAYGHGPNRVELLDAIATYQRSLLTPGSPFDRWLNGDAGAITPTALVGYRLFKSLGCISCHQGVNVGGNLYQRHGIFHPLASPQPEVLRVPSLRNVATTAPYFHDGSGATLSEVVKAMSYAQLDVTLTDQQTAAIVAFLNTLTGYYAGNRVTHPGGEPHAEKDR